MKNSSKKNKKSNKRIKEFDKVNFEHSDPGQKKL
jgi:hypothetical protein